MEEEGCRKRAPKPCVCPIFHDRPWRVGLGHPQPLPSAIMVSSAVRRFLAVCAVIAFVEPLAAQGVQAPPLTVHAIWGSREYASDLVDITWMKDGKAYTAIEQDASGNTDLYQVDAPTGTKQLLVRVTDLATGAETALTTDGGENVINGTSDWVYEEELDLRDAFRWSPDGRRIAFWRFDQTAIRPFYLMDHDSLYPALVPVRYPKSGTPNSTVKIGVTEVASGRTSWVDLGADRDIYIAAIDFADSPTELWLTRLNRHQNRLDLLLADATSGATRVIMSDSDSSWVDANRPRWITGGKQFLFDPGRDGYDQVYLFNPDGSLVRRLTPGGWDVFEVVGVDEQSKVLYFTGAIDGPLAPVK